MLPSRRWPAVLPPNTCNHADLHPAAFLFLLLFLLLQIQKIMEEKGFDHAAAFTKPRRERGEGGEGGGGEAAGPAGAFTKKRRI